MIAIAGRFLAANPPPGRVVLCSITGSHHYGFSSADSDIDIKGIHLAPIERILGLSPPADAHDRLEVFEDVECDLTTNEARQALSLLLKGNGNMLERILSPFQLLDGDEVVELQELARECVARNFFHHYRGYLRGMQREHAVKNRAKTALYCYRVALTGTHLLRTGELVADLRQLAEPYGFPEALELIAVKAEGTEKATLDAGWNARVSKAWPRLEATLVEAHEASPLPDQPPNAPAIDDWLIRTRRSRQP